MKLVSMAFLAVIVTQSLAQAEYVTGDELRTMNLCSKQTCNDGVRGQNYRKTCTQFWDSAGHPGEIFVSRIMPENCYCPCTLEYVTP